MNKVAVFTRKLTVFGHDKGNASSHVFFIDAAKRIPSRLFLYRHVCNRELEVTHCARPYTQTAGSASSGTFIATCGIATSFAGTATPFATATATAAAAILRFIEIT